MIICSVSLVLPWLLFLLVTVQLFLSQNTYGFAIINRNNNNIRTRTRTSHADRICNTSFKAAAKEEEDSLSSSKSDLLLLFPVLSKIAGIQWEGTCRYVNSDLIPQKFLKLHGGIQFSIDTNTEGVNSSIALQLQLQSYIVFPNGKRRDIQMSGTRGPVEYPSMRLDPTPTIEGNDGPIYMVVTELGPDTIMINEVDKVSKMIVMTSSLSLVFDDSTDDDNKKIKELIQVSHEVAPSVPPPFKSTTATKQTKISQVIDGHQVWRFHPVASKAKVLEETDQDNTNDDNDDDRVGFEDKSFQ